MFTRKELEKINSYIPGTEVDLKNKLAKFLAKPMSIEEMLDIAKTMTYDTFVETYLVSPLERLLFQIVNKDKECDIEPLVESLYCDKGYNQNDILVTIERLKKQNILWDVYDMDGWIGNNFVFKKE